MDDDIDIIMSIMELAFDPVWGEAWNRRQICNSLLMPNIHYRMASKNNGLSADGSCPAGFTLVRSTFDEEELLLIAVDPAMRRSGVGRRLMDDVVADARVRGATQLFLEMRANNPAEKLYRNYGFEPVGRRTNYYSAPKGRRIDAITFRLQL